MFGRQVTMKLKANAAAELTRIAETEIVPILRRQKGFRDETIFIAPERAEAIANSFWDTQEDAEAYSRTAYPEVLRVLANAIEGIPTVRTFNFVSSTCNRLSLASCRKVDGFSSTHVMLPLHTFSTVTGAGVRGNIFWV